MYLFVLGSTYFLCKLFILFSFGIVVCLVLYGGGGLVKDPKIVLLYNLFVAFLLITLIN